MRDISLPHFSLEHLKCSDFSGVPGLDVAAVDAFPLQFLPSLLLKWWDSFSLVTVGPFSSVESQFQQMPNIGTGSLGFASPVGSRIG